jgi:hypothetical protein
VLLKNANRLRSPSVARNIRFIAKGKKLDGGFGGNGEK